MDLSHLRYSQPHEVALFLRRAASTLGTETVTGLLLTSIENEYLPPHTFAVWLTASGDPAVVVAGLGQRFSKSIRTAAIRQFAKLFVRTDPDEVWNAVGGTSSLLDFLAQASVSHVRHFCREVGWAGAKLPAGARQRELVDQLYKTLNCGGLSVSGFGSMHSRPFFKGYANLLPACSSQLRSSVSQEGEGIPEDYVLLKDSCVPISERRNLYLDKYSERETFTQQTENLLPLLDDHGSEPGPAGGERISANMQFSMDALEILSRENAELDERTHRKVQNELITPLFQRLVRWKARPATVAAATSYYVRYHQLAKRRKLDNLLDLRKKGVVCCIITRWARHPDALEQTLTNVLQLVPAENIRGEGNEDVARLVRLAPMSLRLCLLRHLLQDIHFFSDDIGTDEGLRDSKFQWSAALFLRLPKREARKLLERLMTLKPDQCFMQRTSDLHSNLGMLNSGDPTGLLLVLSNEDPNGLESAREHISARKEEATKSRRQPDRSSSVGTAIEYAVASGSLELLQDVFRWARRFGKDPLTVRHIYSLSSLQTPEGIGLLRGFPSHRADHVPSLDVILRNVRGANEFCQELFHAAREALGEPEFRVTHWEPVLTLFGAVCRSRVECVDLLQSRLQLSDEQVYETVWNDTLETCIKMEELGLQEANIRIQFNLVGGPLMRYAALRGLPPKTNPSAATLRFLNDLARCRNQLWGAHRRIEHPAVLMLPDAYPRGLPLHHMLPISFDFEAPSRNVAPSFLGSRAKDVVFIDPRSALSPLTDDEEALSAIGVFVEDWKTALTTYVALSPDRKQSALAAWNHAIGPLSMPRLTSTEAFLFWSVIFRSIFGPHDIDGPWTRTYRESQPEPSIPLTGNEGTTEWNPDSASDGYNVKPRKLEVTILDAMLLRPEVRSANIRSRLVVSDVRTSGMLHNDFWQHYLARRHVAASTKEALILAALTYINAEARISPDTFLKPFAITNSGDVRFPGQYLDDEFLKQHEGEEHLAVAILEKFSNHVPPTLVMKMAEAAFLNERRSMDAQQPPPVAFKLLKLLAQGDRPQMSLELIQHLVLDRPNESSWQRRLFSQGTLNALPANAVKDFIENLSKGIQARLNQAKISTADTNARNQPFIKVTTVKMLAQLLSGAEFVDEATTIRILIDLFQNARHHDIRVAIVVALLQVFVKTTSQDTRASVISVLAQYAVPLMSNVNERTPVSEQQWLAFEADSGALPEVYTDGGHLPPMLSAVTDVFRNAKNMTDDARQQLLDHVLLPTIVASISQNTRWMQCFFRHLDVPALRLPDCTVTPALILYLLNHIEWLPNWVMELWLDKFKFEQMSPPEVEAIRTRLEEDPKLRKSNASNHWHICWVNHRWNASKPADLLQTKFQPRSPGAIDRAKLQDVVLKQGDIILQKGDPASDTWDRMLLSLRPPARSSYDAPLLQSRFRLWRKYCFPVIEELVHRIDSMRTESWKQDPHRAPKVLPKTFPLRTWLALYRDLSTEEARHRTDPALITTAISPLLDELGTRAQPYPDRYKYLADATEYLGLTKGQLVAIVTELAAAVEGRGDALRTADYLRVDLAGQMLAWIAAPDDGVVECAAGVVDSWIAHPDEEIREMGYVCARKLEDESGWKEIGWVARK